MDCCGEEKKERERDGEREGEGGRERNLFMEDSASLFACRE